MEYFIVAVSAMMIVMIVRASFDAPVARQVVPVLIIAFIARLVVHVFVLRSGAIGYGGDNYIYEHRAMEIVAYWESEGFQYVGSDQIASLKSVAVPCHFFAVIFYLCGGPAHLASASFVAFVASGMCIVIYKFARLVGADERAAFRLLAVIAFLPMFLVHTSDTFKDGFNVFLVVTCLYLSISRVQGSNLWRLLMLVPLLWALWDVRPYMVFMCGLPLILGIVSRSRLLSLRTVVVSTALLLPALIFLQGVDDSAPMIAMQEQLERAQSDSVLRTNAEGGSGVTFDDGGSVWGAIVPKLLYTLLAPFPWMDGSFALQLGKIDTVIWYYLLFCALSGARRLWRYDSRLFLILMLFIVPSTIAYATTMANVGLIFRQRMPIVMVVSLLSAVAWTKASQDGRTGDGGSGDPIPAGRSAVPAEKGHEPARR
ncbi:hypothetical protein ACFV1N_44845 [Streptosporangium canum]|uniref:hypothetical protein n=1 Tax=Streptosporangium canum TaxID=324952 RepID=UPI00369BC902